jgi:hypothetical protein
LLRESGFERVVVTGRSGDGGIDGHGILQVNPGHLCYLPRVIASAITLDGLAPDVVNAEHAWWYPEAPAPDYRWRESCLNLLSRDEHFDPETGAEPLKCYLCRLSKE